MNNPRRKAFITGITGQDGSYLAELLLGRGYDVWGLVRRSSSFNTARIQHLYQDPHEQDVRLHLVYGDMTDASALHQMINGIRPDEVYNLAAQSHVRVSFDEPCHTTDVAALGTLRLLEAVRHADKRPRFYQASTSEIFGNAPAPQNEQTPFAPRSPYACAKLCAHQLTVNYREAYGLHASCGILFNHESPRRGKTFVTRKITRGFARLAHGLQDKLYLGNLDAQRDWGWAPDYVCAMYLMLQQDEPDDYVIATGETHTVRDFAEQACVDAGLPWAEGSWIETDARYYRPTEVDDLCGDAGKARSRLGWRPFVGLGETVRRMVAHDVAEAAQEHKLRAMSGDTDE